jgi:ankyrin repeat protein
VAKSGFTREVAPLMNLSKATRECKNLQREMREVKMGRRGKTQLNYYCQKGMTSSVVRMLEMRSIDVEAKEEEYGYTCLMMAAYHGHLAICRLLIDKGAQVEAKVRGGWTPLLCAAHRGLGEIVRLLCDHGADVEACNRWGRRPLHLAAYYGHISVVKELIEERNAEVNARTNDGETALTMARHYNKLDVAAYLVSRGGIL